MAAVQKTLTFRVRKKAPLQFYASKLETPIVNGCSPEKKAKLVTKDIALPKIKKLVELDSDDENIDLINLGSPRRGIKRPHSVTFKAPIRPLKRANTSDSDSDCSPTKISRHIKSNSANRLSVQKKDVTDLRDLESKPNNKKEDAHNVRLALHTSVSRALPGREEELSKLEEFLNDHLENKKSGTLYVSGPPGTGKTACLSNILDRPEFKKEFTEVYVNCTTMRSAGSIFGRICQELHLKTTSCNERSYLKAIDKYLAGKHKMILLVLDEIDQLNSNKQSVLYTIFEWPARVRSNIVLIGIANALDLTDRILPRLQARCELRPQLMHFAPYSKQQIVNIFTERLEKEVSLDLFSPVAIQMLAGKVAAISGDVRRALDIGRRVAELASPKPVLKSTSNVPQQGSVVGLTQVMSVLNDVYGTSQRLQSDVDDSFPLQQKLLLCSLLLILDKGKNKDVTLGRLHDVYKRVCVKRNIVPVDNTEFVSICGLIETRGIIRLGGKKEPRTRKVALQWDQSEVTGALSDKQMISDILNDICCLGQ